MSTRQWVLVLEVVSSVQKGKTFEVERAKGAKLRRTGLTLMQVKASGEIRFPEDDDLASHNHARIEAAAGSDDPKAFAIRDIGSLNGTWIDGKRISEAPFALECVFSSSALVSIQWPVSRSLNRCCEWLPVVTDVVAFLCLRRESRATNSLCRLAISSMSAATTSK